MGAEGGRTAFRVWPAYDHKAKNSVISAVAVEQAGARLYLGLSDGQLEEHRVQLGPSSIRVALGARKHVGKKVWFHRRSFVPPLSERQHKKVF